MGDLTKHFSSSEFACSCCGEEEMDIKFVRKLEALRLRLGRPIIITSGYRCPLHNTDVGGAVNSSHLKGWAADIHCESDKERYEVVSLAFSAPGLMSLFNRIGLGKTFIHLDADPDKNRGRIWLY